MCKERGKNMNSQNLKKAMVEVETIIKESFPEEKVKLIPKKIIDFLNENKDTEYIFKYDKDKELDEQVLMEETKLMLGAIFINYLATSDEKNEMIEKLNENEKKYLEELNEKYSIEKIFEKRKQTAEQEVESSNNSLIEYHENFITKIINIIKKFFKKGKK
jgi:predicted RNA-binding protein Jag